MFAWLCRGWCAVLVVMACVPVATVAGGTPPQATTTPRRVAIDRLGPQIGARVPDFTLPDQRGRRRTLVSLMGPRGLMLVFSRSADW